MLYQIQPVEIFMILFRLNNTFYVKKMAAVPLEFFYKMVAQNFQNAITRQKMTEKVEKKLWGFLQLPKIYLKKRDILITIWRKTKK